MFVSRERAGGYRGRRERRADRGRKYYRKYDENSIALTLRKIADVADETCIK